MSVLKSLEILASSNFSRPQAIFRRIKPDCGQNQGAHICIMALFSFFEATPFNSLSPSIVPHSPVIIVEQTIISCMPSGPKCEQCRRRRESSKLAHMRSSKFLPFESGLLFRPKSREEIRASRPVTVSSLVRLQLGMGAQVK